MSHITLGGQMCTVFAASSPEFFLHHTFIDFVWIRWQNNGPICKRAYFADKEPWQLVGSPFRTIDFVDSYNQGECVKVRYDDLTKRFIEPGEYIGMYQCGLEKIKIAIHVEDR